MNGPGRAPGISPHAFDEDPLVAAIRMGRVLDQDVLTRAVVYRRGRIAHARTLVKGVVTARAYALHGYIDEWNGEITALNRAAHRLAERELARS